jgi:folate-dependent phosphoribosylglycinamide formyltransferase PurN
MLATRPDETEAELAARVLRLEHRLYPAALGAFASGALAVEGEAITPGPLALTDASVEIE